MTRVIMLPLLSCVCAGMMGSVVKNVYAPHVGRDPSEVSVVSIMPCTAKKDEAHRTQDSRVTFSPLLGKTVGTQALPPPPKGIS
jgi:iron only hydrogenase large subunit-like protein